MQFPLTSYENQDAKFFHTQYTLYFFQNFFRIFHYVAFVINFFSGKKYNIFCINYVICLKKLVLQVFSSAESKFVVKILIFVKFKIALPIYRKLQIFRNWKFWSQIRIQQTRKPTENQFL